jgi:hypothetical protein
MVPSFFFQVAEIPLSASGKVDKKALLESGAPACKRVSHTKHRGMKKRN